MTTTERIEKLADEYARLQKSVETRLAQFRHVLADSDVRSEKARKTLRKAHYLP